LSLQPHQLCAGDAQVKVAGFRRTPKPVVTVAGCRAVDFGCQTFDARFSQRIGAVLRTVIGLRRYEALFADVDLVVARNLEMVAIGARGRDFCKKPLPVLLYECIDIHRLMLSRGPADMVLRWLDRRLSRRAAAIINSSPAFVTHYFHRIAHLKNPIRLVENKVLDIKEETPLDTKVAPRTPGPPWIIGWFGKIRCTRSLNLLIELAQQSEGKVEVIIRGKPPEHLFGNFEQKIPGIPGIKFLGSYRNPQDLEDIYRNIHFTWAIDMYQEGLNSSWLLPNRIYEGGLYGAVPMALDSVEPGRFLKNLAVGVMLKNPLRTSLRDFFATLTPEKYHEPKKAVLLLPRANWVCSRSECEELVKSLATLRKTQRVF